VIDGGSHRSSRLACSAARVQQEKYTSDSVLNSALQRRDFLFFILCGNGAVLYSILYICIMLNDTTERELLK
jgi:hypothetical protein